MKRRVLVRFRISTVLLLLAVDSRCVSFVVVGDSLAMFQLDVFVFVVADVGLSTCGVRYCGCSCATGYPAVVFLSLYIAVVVPPFVFFFWINVLWFLMKVPYVPRERGVTAIAA
ncbi:hypothetical protein ACFO0U_04010 [Chromohalobacter sarecensis]|uniref:Uncharacterized protein n=1 Tax=Chromohalobacter sarecensis TaxID=245294 RepID=A0ABV9CXS6_9GAMM|nr:hypothetical protein [Chromohalobacter sarecensis]MCK0715086.1 hypothetical protein [Chromohalobacter sarecensis]